MKRKMDGTEKRATLCIRLSPIILEKLEENIKNKSKYIEHLIYIDMVEKNKLESNLIL